MNKKTKCKGCGKTFEKRLLSRKGYCRICAYNRWQESVKQMREKKGPMYEKWKDRRRVGLKRYLKGKK
jgi:rRNA maturation endonuclease Nob1